MLIILSLFVMACSNIDSGAETTKEDEHELHDSAMTKPVIALQLNNGAKWKTDEATRKNVGEIVRLINDSSIIGEKNRAQLTKQLQARIDTLVQQCRMKGPDHDALHLWLQQVLNNLKALKEEDNEYQRSYAALKEEVENFYSFFE